MAGWASEAQTRRIVWPEWSGDIVEKFLEWLYTNDYTIPLPTQARMVREDTQVSRANDVEEDRPSAVKEDFPYQLQEEEWRTEPEPAPEPAEPLYPASPEIPVAAPQSEEPSKSSENMSSQRNAEKGPLARLEELRWNGSHPIKKTSRSDDFDSWMMHHMSEIKLLDYEATFITHATLYVIACQKDLIELKNMAWQRLRSLLVTVEAPVAGRPIIADLVALIRYTYKETGVSELPVDPLRDLLTTYVAIHFTAFKGPEVDNLFSSASGDDRDFVVDLMVKVRQSMANLEAKKNTVLNDDGWESYPIGFKGFTSFKEQGKKGKSRDYD